MKDYIGQKVLVTTEGWFYGTDGKLYRGAWGTLKAIHEAKDALGILPNRPNVNWFIEIGDMTVMGCQIMFVIKCPAPPPEDDIPDHSRRNFNSKRPGEIFIMNDLK